MEQYFTDAITSLNSKLKDINHDLWFVGECVLDTLLNNTPTQLELYTKLSLDELRSIIIGLGYTTFDLNGGLQVVDQGKEIIFYSSDGQELEDFVKSQPFTATAVAYDLENGFLYPINIARIHISQKKPEFNGSPEILIRNNPMVLLQYIRLCAKFERSKDVLADITLETINHLKSPELVGDIKREIRNTLLSANPDIAFGIIASAGIDYAIGLPIYSFSGHSSLISNARSKCDDPEVLLAYILKSPQKIMHVADKWKFSTYDTAKMMTVGNFIVGPSDLRAAKIAIAAGNAPREWIKLASLILGGTQIAETLETWVCPEFDPVKNPNMTIHEWAYKTFK